MRLPDFIAMPFGVVPEGFGILIDVGLACSRMVVPAFAYPGEE